MVDALCPVGIKFKLVTMYVPTRIIFYIVHFFFLVCFEVTVVSSKGILTEDRFEKKTIFISNIVDISDFTIKTRQVVLVGRAIYLMNLIYIQY